MLVIVVLLQFWQERKERSFRVAYKTEINAGSASKLLTANVDLHNRRIRRIELPIRKVSPDHQQHIAAHHCVIAGGESEQPCHTDIKRVVILDELFPTHGMHDGSL